MAPEWVFEGMKATREEIGIKDYVKSLVLHMGKLHKLKEQKVQMKSYSQIVAMETWMIMMCTVRKTDDISIRSWNNITLGILLYLLFDTTIYYRIKGLVISLCYNSIGLHVWLKLLILNCKIEFVH